MTCSLVTPASARTLLRLRSVCSSSGRKPLTTRTGVAAADTHPSAKDLSRDDCESHADGSAGQLRGRSPLGEPLAEGDIGAADLGDQDEYVVLTHHAGRDQIAVDLGEQRLLDL